MSAMPSPLKSPPTSFVYTPVICGQHPVANASDPLTSGEFSPEFGIQSHWLPVAFANEVVSATQCTGLCAKVSAIWRVPFTRVSVGSDWLQVWLQSPFHCNDAVTIPLT